MYFVYSLQSELFPEHYYIGMTSNIIQRLEEHNAGKSTHTNKFKPWKLVAYIAFTDKLKAEQFEKYLKTGSGRAFSKKRLW